MTFDEADADYPFDPAARAPMLVGIEKMRAFDDPKMRRNVFDLFVVTKDRIAKPREDWRTKPRRECVDTEDPTQGRYP